MLEPIIWHEDGEVRQVDQLVQFSDRLPNVFRQRMEQLEAVHRWLAGYFHAVAILLQIPGAAEYRCTDDERTDFWDFIWTHDTDVPLTLLAETLDRLDAADLITQVPGGDDYHPRKLPDEVHLRLAMLDRNELLNVVAECLDRLLVVPELEVEAELYGIEGMGGMGGMGAPPRRRWWPFGKAASRRTAREGGPTRKDSRPRESGRRREGRTS